MINASLDALRRDELAGTCELKLAAGLTAFPQELFSLTDTLEVLDLSGNALSSLPDDMGRFSKLRVLFCSGNRFTRLPPSLGDCAALSQVGFRATGLQEIPAESLPPALRWLTVTDNQLDTLPDALGERPMLQKLMLSGNRLRDLPERMAGLPRLELLRLSANRFEALPGWLADLPALAWLAWSGNPLDASTQPVPTSSVRWQDVRIGQLLGEGASGRVHEARWQHDAEAPERTVALKVFKGTMTSDGLPEREMAATLAAGTHPHLIGALGRLTDHPERLQGLLMPLLPQHWRVLAGPPSLESCSRDVYDAALRLDLPVALRIARGVGAAALHLHRCGMLHGDLYGHNVLWDGTSGEAVLSDFGAASFLPGDTSTATSGGPVGLSPAALKRTEVRAWGVLLGELLDLTAQASPALRTLQQRCIDEDLALRPTLPEALEALEALS